MLALVAASGCGGDDDDDDDVVAGIDAATGDFDAGGETADAAQFGVASVTVVLNGNPSVGTAVVFHDASGAVAGETATDASGTASYEVERDSLATVVLGNELFTVAGIRPGDSILLATPDGPPTASVGSVSVTASDAHPTADDYELWIGCDLSPTVADLTVAEELTLRESCLQDDGVFDALAAARDGDGVALAYSFATDITPVLDGVTDVSLPAWSAPATVTVDYTGAPTDALGISAAAQPWRDGLTFMQQLEGGPLDGSASIPLPYPDGFADELDVRVSISRGDTAREVSDVLVRRIASPPVILAVTPADFLPSLDSATLDLSTTPGRPRVTWPGDTSAADGVIILLQYQTDAVSYGWRAAVPPGTDGFTFPALPTAFQDRPPTESSTIGAQSNVQAIEATFIDDYGDFVTTVVLGLFNYYLPYTGEFELRASQAPLP